MQLAVLNFKLMAQTFLGTKPRSCHENQLWSRVFAGELSNVQTLGLPLDMHSTPLQPPSAILN